MINLDEYLNRETEGKFGFLLKSAKLSKVQGKCFIEMFYNDGVILPADTRKKCEELIMGVMPSGFSYEIKFIKKYLVKEALESKIKEYFAKNHPSINYEIKAIECEGENKYVKIAFDEKQKDYVASKKIMVDLENFLLQNFSTKISVISTLLLEQVETNASEDIEILEENFMPITTRVIEVSNVEPVVGDLKDNVAFYIKDKQNIGDEVVFCGNLLYINELSYKRKPRQKNAENVAEEGKNAGEETEERKFFKFTLEDFTGKISAVYFPKKQEYESMLTLAPRDTLIISGNLEEDKFAGGVSLRVKNISRCTLPEKFEEEIIYKDEPKAYRYVFPEPCIYYAQTDLFSMGSETVNKNLAGKDFVVFDLETTGFEVSAGDRICEIGAVKVRDGKIAEKFWCMVNPEKHIPAEVSKVTHIFDEDVKGAHTYEEVLPDFYKFTRNSTLVAHNIRFDYGFISHYGKKCGYNFDNPQIDTLRLAQKGVRGLKNYKLGTIAEKLGVSLENAHRAVNDATATAEVFIKLADFIDK